MTTVLEVRDLSKQFARVCSHHVRPHNFLFLACQYELDKSGRCMLCLRPVDIRPRKGDDSHLSLPLLCFGIC